MTKTTKTTKTDRKASAPQQKILMRKVYDVVDADCSNTPSDILMCVRHDLPDVSVGDVREALNELIRTKRIFIVDQRVVFNEDRTDIESAFNLETAQWCAEAKTD